MRLRILIYGRMALAAVAVLFFPGAMYTLDFKLLLLPSLLIGYYLAVWFLAGQGPRAGAIVPQYAPPDHLSPAEMRYLRTRASDGKTVAAVLAHLASQKVIAIEPEGNGYRITRLATQPTVSLPPEEACAYDALAELEDLTAAPGLPPRTFVFQPDRTKYLNLIGSVIAGSLSKRIGNLYFKRNLKYSLPATLLSVVWALVIAARVGRHGEAVFLTLWFLLFSLGLGVVLAANLPRALHDAFSGMLSAKNLATMFLPLPLFLAVPGFVAFRIGVASSPTFAWVLVSLVLINIVGGIAIQTVTTLGRQRADQVEGFRQFLAGVELDRLDRMNDPRLTPALLNDYMAYAIALDLKEAWGDHLANAWFATATTAG